MSSLIEQAAQRLAQLRQAGIAPEDTAPTPRIDAAAAAALTPLAPAARSVSNQAEEPPQAAARRVELDLEALARAGIVTPSAARSRIADQYRVIKRPLILNAVGKGASTIAHGNLIMVTSALAGEGKSFTSVNLAMSIAAELDHTVMLVDADVARPSVLRMLGLPPAPGLLDVLEQSDDLSNVLLRTNIDKLTLLPAGTAHPRATELLASDAMAQLLQEISTRYADRIVIFDSPPLLLTTESRVLASHMGQVVVVVQAEKTLQSDVQNALATIEACPVRLMLLNNARSDTRDAYGYGYGAYGSEYRDRNAKPAAGAA